MHSGRRRSLLRLPCWLPCQLPQQATTVYAAKKCRPRLRHRGDRPTQATPSTTIHSASLSRASKYHSSPGKTTKDFLEPIRKFLKSIARSIRLIFLSNIGSNPGPSTPVAIAKSAQGHRARHHASSRDCSRRSGRRLRLAPTTQRGAT